MKKLLTMVAAGLTMMSCDKQDENLTVSGITKDANARVAATGAWVRQFTDDFNTINVSTVWQSFTNASGTNTDPNSVYCTYSKAALKVAAVDGSQALVITGVKTGTNAWRSGRIKSFYAITPTTNTEYRVSARIKVVGWNGSAYVPFSSTYGAWPAFWTTQETNWPIYGEVDVLEGYSKSTASATDASFTSNLFYGTVANTDKLKNSLLKKYSDVISFNSSTWHTYDLYWSNTNGVVSVTTKVDGVTIMTRTNSSSTVLNLNNFKNHNIILNLCVGSNANVGIFDMTKMNLLTNTQMWVDYVTVDKRTL